MQDFYNTIKGAMDKTKNLAEAQGKASNVQKDKDVFSVVSIFFKTKKLGLLSVRALSS